MCVESRRSVKVDHKFYRWIHRTEKCGVSSRSNGFAISE